MIFLLSIVEYVKIACKDTIKNIQPQNITENFYGYKIVKISTFFDRLSAHVFLR